MAEALGLHVLDHAARVEVVQVDRCEPGAQEAARVLGAHLAGARSVARVSLAQQALHQAHHAARIRRRCVGAALAPVVLERAQGERDRRVRPLRGASLRAARAHTSSLHVTQELLWSGCRRGLCPGAPDVNARVVVAAADADAVERGDVHRCRAVELARTRSVARLPDLEQLRQPAAMACGQRRADGVPRVSQRAGDPALAHIPRAQPHVVAVCLQPLVILKRDPVAEHVHRLGFAAEVRSELL